MTEKQLFYPLLSVYFSLILGDLQKEKLQIVSIFRFGHKKRGLFQCPPLGRVGEGLTQGAGAHSRCVLGGWMERPPLGEGWGGAYTRGESPFSLCFRWLGGTPSLWGGLGRDLHKGRESILAVFEVVGWYALPLGRVGEGLLGGLGRGLSALATL